MEKLKEKHNHSLTNILKVLTFAIVLLFPFLVFMPTAFYYGFNEHANAPTTEVENKTQVDFNQLSIYKTGTYLSVTYSDNENTLYLNGLMTSVPTYGQFPLSEHISFKRDGTKYYIKFDNSLNLQIGISGYGSSPSSYIWSTNATNDWNGFIYLYTPELYNFENVEVTFQVFNLTQMFGSGKEPTMTEFDSLFTDYYYQYTLSEKIEIPNGTYTTYTDISKSISFAWQSIWEKPLFKWTENTPFTATTNAFASVFNISQESGFYNLIAYFITITGIYLIIDIVIGVATWLTHMIGRQD